MSVKSVILAGAAALALASAPFAASYAATGTVYGKNATAAANATGKQASNTAANHEAAATNAQGEKLSQDEIKSAQKLNKVNDPQQTLADAKVADRAGNPIGDVSRVITGPKGMAQSLHVNLNGAQSKTVAINANRLSWVPGKKMVVASLSQKQIQAMKAVNPDQAKNANAH